MKREVEVLERFRVVATNGEMYDVTHWQEFNSYCSSATNGVRQSVPGKAYFITSEGFPVDRMDENQYCIRIDGDRFNAIKIT